MTATRWPYTPVIPPAQRLAELAPVAARMPAQHEAVRRDIEVALRDPQSAIDGMPRSVDHWADCFIAAREALAADRETGLRFASGKYANVLAMGAEVALLHVQSQLRASAPKAIHKLSTHDLATRPPEELAAGMMASIDVERALSSFDRLAIARRDFERELFR